MAAAAEAGAAQGSEQQGSGRTRRKAAIDGAEQRNLRQRTAKEAAKRDERDKASCKGGRISAVGEKAADKGAARGGKGGGRGRGRGGKAGGRGGGRGAAEEPPAEAESDLEEPAGLISEFEKDTLRIKFTVGDSFAPGSKVVVTPSEVLADAQDEEFEVGT